MDSDREKQSLFTLRYEFAVCLFLVLAILAIYGQVRHHDFADFDDRIYVTANQHVLEGLTIENIRWALSFEDKDKTYWHPLTWLSHMLDVQFYGKNPRGHHLSNVLFHMANTLLLFLILRCMTGTLWKAAFAASLFALHPINAESVAWIAERKNVLSTFFWMLTMLAYIRYTERPGFCRYGWVILTFVLGLMAKPVLVTLPFVLLLLDYWPLGRLEIDLSKNGSIWVSLKSLLSNFRESVVLRRILEKIPLMVLSTAAISLSSASLQHHGVVIPLEEVSLKLRLANAVVSYTQYLGKAIWPQNLAFFYPYPTSVPLWETIGALLLLTGISIVAVRFLKSKPYLGIGWFWYLGTLVPVIGIMQAGLWPALADRWAYIPFIGIYIMVSWGFPDLLTKWPYKKIGIPVACVILIISLMVTTHRQARHWVNSTTLSLHALEMTAANFFVHYTMGFALADQGRMAEAVNHYSESLRLNPNYADTHYNMGIALSALKKREVAAKHYREALRIDPDDFQAYNNLGNTLFLQGEIDEAINHYHSALRIKPDYVMAHKNLGAALIRKGQAREAVYHLQEALRIQPQDVQAKKNLKIALALLTKNK